MIVEGLLCLSYLIVSQGVFIPQQIGALGCVTAYTFSVGALLYATKNNPASTISPWVPGLGLVSCAILLTACIRSFFINGMSSLIIYAILLALGICMFVMRRRNPCVAIWTAKSRESHCSISNNDV